MRAEGDVAGMIPKRHVAADLGGGFEVRKQAARADVPSLPGLKLEQGACFR